MKTKKKILAVAIAAIMILIALASVSLAYLQDTDYDQNTMTVGNVKIEQIEQQRDGNGNLVTFEDNKKLLPATCDPAWSNESIDINGKECPLFVSNVNPIDKIVTVNNIGSEDAYVRTLVAFENTDTIADRLIHFSHNMTDWTMEELSAKITINNKQYVLLTFTYNTALAARANSTPNLIQIFLDKSATNEDMANLANGYDILVLSQAVQSAGWSVENGTAAAADYALDTAFGAITAENATTIAGWFANATERT